MSLAPASRRLARDRRGAAAIEFALSLPVLLLLGMYGAEVAHMASVNVEVSQLALSVADNASRLGQTDNSGVTPTIAETDVDAVLFGAIKQGATLQFATRGRVVLSSLEKDSATGKQYIRWQRCRGGLNRASAYGNDSDRNGLNGPEIAGLGAGRQIVTAKSGSAVMFAEVFYEYRGLFGSLYTGTVVLKREAAFIVRDDRNLATGLTGGNSQSRCT